MGTPNVSVRNGFSGGVYIGGTTLTSGGYAVVQVLADSKFHTLSGNVSGVANTTEGSAPTIPAGTNLYGFFTDVKLHSGRVVAYLA
jgi:hypothetical protein